MAPMTLVVARITPLGIRMTADMRVTDPSAIRRGYVHGALKLIALAPTLCVGYAGNVDFALQVIREIASLGPTFHAARDRLVDANQRSGGASDFLVAGLRPSRLIEIKNSRGVSCSAGWIGDARAFAEYQAEYHRDQHIPPREMFDSGDQADDIEIASRMSAGMHAVVEGPVSVGEGEDRVLTPPQGGRHEAVGEALVKVHPRAEDNLFSYQVSTRAQAPMSSDPLPPASGSCPRTSVLPRVAPSRTTCFILVSLASQPSASTFTRVGWGCFTRRCCSTVRSATRESPGSNSWNSCG